MIHWAGGGDAQERKNLFDAVGFGGLHTSRAAKTVVRAAVVATKAMFVTYSKGSITESCGSSAGMKKAAYPSA
jgi:hypothetical protein